MKERWFRVDLRQVPLPRLRAEGWDDDEVAVTLDVGDGNSDPILTVGA